jgi:acetyl-CoA carboxylase biotin carboxyl carrier protein
VEKFRDYLEDLVNRVCDTNIAELEFRSQGFRISLRRRIPSAEPSSSSVEKAAINELLLPKGPGIGEVDIRSPLSGIFYVGPSPGESPFVNIGDEIEPGQIVGLVEAMKVFNEIVADVAGTVLAVLVSEGTDIEDGEPVLRVRLATE